MIGLNGPLQVSPTTMNSIFRVHFSRFLFKVDLGRHEQSSRQNVSTPEIACDLIFVLVVEKAEFVFLFVIQCERLFSRIEVLFL